MGKENLIKDKKLAIRAIKKNRYQIEKVDKKFLGDKEIIKAGLNSKNPYDYESWEMAIEKIDDRYDFVVVTHKIFNKIGYHAFQPDDVYAAYVPNELVQEIFDYLISTVKLPRLSGIDQPK